MPHLTTLDGQVVHPAGIKDCDNVKRAFVGLDDGQRPGAAELGRRAALGATDPLSRLVAGLADRLWGSTGCRGFRGGITLWRIAALIVLRWTAYCLRPDDRAADSAWARLRPVLEALGVLPSPDHDLLRLADRWLEVCPSHGPPAGVAASEAPVISP